MMLPFQNNEAETAEPPEVVEVLRLGKDEMNLAEFPIALLSDRVPKGKKVVQYQDRVFDEKTGKHIVRKLTISADEANGLPTAIDDDVILGLIQMTKMVNNFASRDVEFSRLELIKMLGWPDSGDSYRRITTSLKRWLSVTLFYENAWRDNRSGEWVTKGFHILDNIELNNSRKQTTQGELFPSKITWNKVVFESFEAGYLKSIDYGLYVALRHPIARRMYRFLSKRMYFGPDLTFDLRDLAFAHIGISENYSGNAAKIKEKLQPAIDELVKFGFLEFMEKKDRFTKKGKEWEIRLIQKAPAFSVALPTQQASGPEMLPIVAELVRRGVINATAETLAEKHQAVSIGIKIEIFDWLVEKQDKRIEKNPAGYLVKSIADDYAAPKGFVCKAERERRQEAKDTRELAATEEQRRTRQARTREQEESQAVDTYWESLTPKQQVDLQAKADAQADPAMLKLETRHFKQIGQTIRRNDYIRHLLASQKSEPA